MRTTDILTVVLCQWRVGSTIELTTEGKGVAVAVVVAVVGGVA